MSTFWQTNNFDDINLAKLGPYIDGVVGTNGEYQDLYAAVMTGGWKRIVLAAGCTMSADLTISANDGFIITLGNYWLVANSNTRRLTITGARWRLQGFSMNNPTGVGITISGDRCILDTMGIFGATSHGLQFTGGDDHSLSNCFILNSTGDGVLINAGVDRCRVLGNAISGNGGWGINDASNTIIEASNYVAGNTSGGINSTSLYVNGRSYGGIWPNP